MILSPTSTKKPTPIGYLTIDQAIMLAHTIWETSWQSIVLDNYQEILEQFRSYASVNEVQLINHLSPQLVIDFSNSPTTHNTTTYNPDPCTTRARLSALWWLYQSLQLLGYHMNNAADILPLPEHMHSEYPTVSDDVADQLFLHAHENPTYQEPVIIGLLLSGCWSEEIRYLAVDDFHPEDKTIFIHGTNKYRPRTLQLEDHIAAAIAHRISYLATYGNTSRLVFAYEPQGHDTHIDATIAQIARYAHLCSTDITPAQLTAYAGNAMFQATDNIVAVANLLGLRSLDSAAQLIDLQWEVPEVPQDWGKNLSANTVVRL